MTDSEFSFSLDLHGPTVHVSVAGEVDAFAAPQVWAAVDDALTAGGRFVSMDLGDVTFFSAAGVGLLVRVQRGADEAGGSVRIESPSDPVRWVCTIVGEAEALGVDPLDWPLSPRCPARRMSAVTAIEWVRGHARRQVPDAVLE